MVDRACDRHPLLDAVRAAVEAGVDWVQLRDRELTGADYLSWARALRAASRGARIIVNRRIDVALALALSGMDWGVHLGFDALPPAEARALLPADAEIGVSAHTPDEVRAARDDGASYAHLAPIWKPISKPSGGAALGAAGLRTACRFGLPVLAQGGVSAERCPEALAAGAAGIAVTGSVLLAEDPGAAAAALRAALDA